MATSEYQKRVDQLLNKDPKLNTPGNTRKIDYYTQLNKQRNPEMFNPPKTPKPQNPKTPGLEN